MYLVRLPLKCPFFLGNIVELPPGTYSLWWAAIRSFLGRRSVETGDLEDIGKLKVEGGWRKKEGGLQGSWGGHLFAQWVSWSAVVCGGRWSHWRFLFLNSLNPSSSSSISSLLLSLGMHFVLFPIFWNDRSVLYFSDAMHGPLRAALFCTPPAVT